jgi:hypothetical protein
VREALAVVELVARVLDLVLLTLVVPLEVIIELLLLEAVETELVLVVMAATPGVH